MNTLTRVTLAATALTVFNVLAIAPAHAKSGRTSSPPARAFYACAYLLDDPARKCVPIDLPGINLNADQGLSPASLNKMMTAHLVLQHMKQNGKGLDDPFTTVSAQDNEMGRVGERGGQTVYGGRVLPLAADAHLTYRETVHALTVYSANNVAVAAARRIAADGSQDSFASLMTSEARRVGMDDTVFKTASGMPKTGQTTTAEDMAMLVRFLVDNYGVEQFGALFGQSETTIRGARIRGLPQDYVPGHLALLNRPALGVKGGKTGLDAGGSNVAGYAEQGRVGVAFATLHSPNRHLRDTLTSRMINQIFAAFGISSAHAIEVPESARPKAQKSRLHKKQTAPHKRHRAAS